MQMPREESVSQEDSIKIVVEKAEPCEPDEPFEDQARENQELVWGCGNQESSRVTAVCRAHRIVTTAR